MRIVLAAVPWSGMVNSYPPLGLGYLAAALRNDPDIDAEVRIMDFGLFPHLTLEEALERITRGGRPDILGLSCLSNNFHGSLHLARLARKAHHGLRTVLGGAHPSVDPEGAAACEGVDAVVYGEGEVTFRELVKRAARGEWAEGVEGTAFMKDGEVRTNPPRPLIENLDALPFPARDLMDLERYRFLADDGLPVYTLLTSRGCPYSCTYCYKGIFGSRYRARSAQNVLEEIKGLVNTYGARHLYLGDDIFMLQASRVRAFCEGLIRDGLAVGWSCLARVDTVTPDLLDMMRRAGCEKIHFGIESGVPEILQTIGKKIDLQKVEQAVHWTREAGIRTKGYFMAGLPDDTEESLEKTFHFARSLPLDEVMFSLATPFPGTALFDEYVKKAGPILTDALEHAFYFDDGGGEVKAFFNLSRVPTEKLEAFVRRTQRYFRNRKDRASFLRRYGAVAGPLAHMAYKVLGPRGKAVRD